MSSDLHRSDMQFEVLEWIRILSSPNDDQLIQYGSQCMTTHGRSDWGFGINDMGHGNVTDYQTIAVARQHLNLWKDTTAHCIAHSGFDQIINLAQDHEQRATSLLHTVAIANLQQASQSTVSSSAFSRSEV